MHQRLGQMGLGGLAGGQALAQVGAHAHELFDAIDDARLFCEGREGAKILKQVTLIYGADIRRCRLDLIQPLLTQRTAKPNVDEFGFNLSVEP